MTMIAEQAARTRAARPLPDRQPAHARARPAPRAAARNRAAAERARAAAPARAPARPRARAGPSFTVGRRSTTNYESVILAEFVAAIVLVAATPFATKQNSDGLSPYAGADMIKLAALTAVYLILALISITSHGSARYAAWFGGLILLGVGLNEAANIAKTFDLFAGINPKASGG